MIYICQGHEKSIGIEVFIKSFLQLNHDDSLPLTLIINRESLADHLDILEATYEINSDHSVINGQKLNCLFIKKEKNIPQTTASLEKALEVIDPQKDILLTLPTSKDQLILKDLHPAGYTEYFRKFYNLEEIAMLFSAPEDNVLLITDHIPLRDVSKYITAELIYKKTYIAVENFAKYFDSYEEVIFAGINPHIGENGILGSEDSCIAPAIDQLNKKFQDISFLGPFSGDTLFFHKNNKRQLFVYMYHDQGLPVFKARNNVVGLNISLGLPFLRISVDHGTAFDLYGKNVADERGCKYMLDSALKAHAKVNNR